MCGTGTARADLNNQTVDKIVHWSRIEIQLHETESNSISKYIIAYSGLARSHLAQR